MMESGMIISYQNSPKVISGVNKLQTQIFISRSVSILQKNFLNIYDRQTYSFESITQANCTLKIGCRLVKTHPKGKFGTGRLDYSV
jgi:hypothetical protein